MTTSRNVRTDQTLRICFVGLMTAIVFVSNYLRIPFMDTKLTVANALCAISGLLFGPVLGFTAAGLGSFLFDIISGYGAESLITLVSKGAIALLAGLIAGNLSAERKLRKVSIARVVIGCVVGAFTYVALYMLKTWLFGLYVNGLTPDATLVKMASKLPGSLINAVFASIVGPVLFFGMKPALTSAGLMKKMNPPKSVKE